MAGAPVNKGGKFFVCSTAQSLGLTETGFEALTWVEVENVVSIGDTGTEENTLTHNYWGTDYTQHEKGIRTATPFDVTVGYDPATAQGQAAMHAAGATNLLYATKIELNDGSATLTNTVKYNLGKITMAKETNGEVEGFQEMTWTVLPNQGQIKVKPEAI
jgi:hypothetical protein